MTQAQLTEVFRARNVDAGDIARKWHTAKLYCLVCAIDCTDCSVEFLATGDVVISRTCREHAERVYSELADRAPDRFPGDERTDRPRKWYWPEHAPPSAIAAALNVTNTTV